MSLFCVTLSGNRLVVSGVSNMGDTDEPYTSQQVTGNLACLCVKRVTHPLPRSILVKILLAATPDPGGMARVLQGVPTPSQGWHGRCIRSVGTVLLGRDMANSCRPSDGLVSAKLRKHGQLCVGTSLAAPRAAGSVSRPQGRTGVRLRLAH